MGSSLSELKDWWERLCSGADGLRGVKGELKRLEGISSLAVLKTLTEVLQRIFLKKEEKYFLQRSWKKYWKERGL